MPDTRSLYVVIDFGNTYKKAAVFENGELVSLKVSKQKSFEAIGAYLETLPAATPCILSSVVDYPDWLNQQLQMHFEMLFLSHETPIPLHNLYATPQTLGRDRIAGAVAAWNLFPHGDLLVIDAGTAITIDFVSARAEYLGGSISPGIDLRFRALHEFTGKLPLVKKKPIDFLTGTTTAESIQSGIINGTLAEIDGIIDRYKEKYPAIKIVIGGGDSNFLHKRLKNSIFALPNLALYGLYIILKHKVENKNS